jgi:hypothetical protein
MRRYFGPGNKTKKKTGAGKLCSQRVFYNYCLSLFSFGTLFDSLFFAAFFFVGSR